MPRRRRSAGKRGPGKRVVDGVGFRLADEIRYIPRRAAEHDGRVVTFGQLTLFSTETGDAWIIDRDDHLALRLACQGDPQPFHIEVERALARSPSAIPFELAGQHRKRRVLGQFAMVVEILVAERQPKNALPNQRLHAVLDVARIAPIGEALRKAPCQPHATAGETSGGGGRGAKQWPVLHPGAGWS